MVVPTIRFQILYVFLVLAHERRRILHFAVTAHPTAEWTAQQMREAFPWDTVPRYLLRDRDRIFGQEFVKQVRAMGSNRCCRRRVPRGNVLTSSGSSAQSAASAWITGSCSTSEVCTATSRHSWNITSEPRSLGIEERYSGAATDPAAGVWPDRVDTCVGRTASPIRAARRVNPALP